MARQLYGKNKRLRRARHTSGSSDTAEAAVAMLSGNLNQGSGSGSETSSLASSIAGSIAGDQARSAAARTFLRLRPDADGAGINLICTSFDTNAEL